MQKALRSEMLLSSEKWFDPIRWVEAAVIRNVRSAEVPVDENGVASARDARPRCGVEPDGLYFHEI